MFETNNDAQTAPTEGAAPGRGRCDPPGWLTAALRVVQGADQAGFAELEAPVLTAAVAGLTRLESRVAALKAAATDAALTTGTVRSSGAATAAQWLVETGGGSTRKARRTAGLASRLRELPGTEKALSEGEVTPNTWM